MPKKILFLSIMDFTDGGIQVVKLTPEYFAKKGWCVHYIVTRDESRHGSYFYQSIVNPSNVIVHRASMPSCRIGETFESHVLKTVYSKFRGYMAVIKLAYVAYGLIRKEDFDVVYGAGVHGVLAAKLLSLLRPNRSFRVVSRFYGIWDLYSRTILQRRWFKLVLNWDLIAALYFKVDLKIITNDGTRGDLALKWVDRRGSSKFKFLVNGIDELPKNEANELGRDRSIFTVVSITRLVATKRIDWCIRVIALIVNKYGMNKVRLVVVGDGVERHNYECLASELNVSANVVFVGSVDNAHVKKYLENSDVFLSMYDVSNVGNPLLEAIRSNKIIFTLNNGDTASWIKHGENGFIYDIDDSTLDRVAQDLIALSTNPALQSYIKSNLKVTEKDKLWTWDERLHVEFTEIEKIVKS